MTGLENRLRELYAAMLAHDTVALGELLAVDSVYVHSTGVVETKAEYLNGVRDGLYQYEQVRSTAQSIRANGNLAVVTDMLDFRGGPRGVVHLPVKLFTTLVWQKHGNVWRLDLRQATRIP